MKRTLLALLTLAAMTACYQQPKVAVEPPTRKAIDIAYVGAPTMIVRSAPQDTAEEVTRYGINETVSIMSRKGEWVEVRTVDGTGWAKAAELITAEQAKAIAEDPLPRFLTPPAVIPPGRSHGELNLQAKVNTDGEVVEVKIAKNTTGNTALANDAAQALLQAKFYPMVQKGQRMTFVYEQRLAY